MATPARPQNKHNSSNMNMTGPHILICTASLEISSSYTEECVQGECLVKLVVECPLVPLRIVKQWLLVCL